MKTPLLPTLLAVTTTLSAQPTKPQIIERGPHHKTWQWEITVAGPDGQTETQTHGYVEVGSGLCRWDGKEWVDGSEVIEVFPGGAIGRSAQMQAIFAPNLNTFGAIDTLAPDGNRIRSHLLGLAFYDLAAQKSVMIAEVKDCVGVVLPPNQVIYRDAFDGQVLADVLFTYRLGSFHQDVVLRAQLPVTPADYGLNSDRTVLEVWTEMMTDREPRRVPQPAVATLRAKNTPAAPAVEMTDEDLDFGATRLVAGRAFSPDGRASANPFSGDALPVSKNWVAVDAGRRCLVEQVAYGALRDQVARALPQAKVTPPEQRAAVQRRRAFPAAPQHAQANRPAQPMQLAGLTPRPGFTIDYEQVVTTTNMTFKGDTTYLVMSTVNLSGTTTIEGGSVLKHTNGNNSVYLYVLSGELQCKTTPWLPAILTSMHDDTVGEVLPGSTNTPSLTSGATRLRSVGTNTVHDLRFRYADYGYVCTPTTGRVGFTNVQFFRCRYPLYLSGGRYDVHNLLLTDCEHGVYNTSTTNSIVNIEHGTFDRVNKLVGGVIVHLNLTNCLLTAVSNQAYFVGESNAFQSNGAGVFQTVGGGEHYLAENSPHRDAGTTNISAGMQTALKNLTTFPPILLSNSINADTVLSPQAGRDTDRPDLGYHYCPVDYMASNVTLRSVLTLSGGVAIGIGGDPGFDCAPNARISSRGDPLAWNRLVGYQNFQERALPNKGALALQISAVGNTNSWFDFRFTDFCNFPGKREPFLSIAYHPYHRISFRDCVFHNGTGYAGPAYLISLTNNLFDRCEFSFRQNYYSTHPIGFFYNNLFRGGKLTITEDASGSSGWQMRDNLFDQSELVYSPAGSSHVSFSNNGFTTNTTNSFGGSNNKTNLTADYVPGPLGDYYYPNTGGSSSLTTLFNTGSRTADLAHLFHFTTTTDQVKEGNSTVDLGYHYVAVTNIAGTWHPIDADGDGVPDYLEDANGNGVTDAGETSCLNPLLSIVGTATYTKGGPPRLLDTNATVQDSDSLELGGGQLRVTLTSGADPGDQLSIRNQGTNVAQIGVSGGVVTYAGVAIATVTGGSGTHSLVVSFNTNATPSAVQALVRNLTFYHPSSHPPDNNRSAAFVLTDGDGGTNAPTSLTIQVQCPAAIDAMIVFDVSASIWNTNFAAAKLAASNFVSLLNFSADRVGLISFAEGAVLDQPLTTNAFAVQTNIAGLARRSGSLIQPAIDLARTNLSQSGSNVVRVLVLLSDGETDPQSTTTNALQAATLAAEAGLRIISLACPGHTGYTYGTNLMRELASSPHDYYFAPASSDFQSNFTAAASALCRETTNLPPQITIVAPNSGAAFAEPLDLLIKTLAIDLDGLVTRVEFYSDQQIAVVSNIPFHLVRTNLQSGSYNVYAVAWDNGGLSSTSAPVAFTVESCAPSPVYSLSINPSNVVGGNVATGTVTLVGAATKGGQVIALTTTNANATAPMTVFVPEGSTTATFLIDTAPSFSTNQTLLAAQYHNTDAKTAVLTMRPTTNTIGTEIDYCGPMDVAFVLDTTSSMGSMLASMKSQITNILDAVEAASAGDYRIALVTFDGQAFVNNEKIYVHLSLTNSSRMAFTNQLYPIRLGEGGAPPEAHDEALNTVVNNLAASASRTNSAGYPLQEGDFSEAWRSYARKLVVLITDNRPSGSNDAFTIGIDDVNAHRQALMALSKGITITSIHVDHGNPLDDLTTVILQDYADTSGGNYYAASSTQLGTAIQASLLQCGTSSGQLVFIRDDERRSDYTTFTTDPVASTGNGAEPALFNLEGIEGSVVAAHVQRTGLLRHNGGSHFDLEFGVQTVGTNPLPSFGSVLTNLDAMSIEQPYAAEWILPSGLHSNVHQRLGGVFELGLVDRISSTCGSNRVTWDSPQADWPLRKNILSLKTFGSPDIPQGRCRDLILNGTIAPLNGIWDIRLYGQIVGSSGTPNGWSVEPDHSVYGGLNIGVPAHTLVARGYEVRFTDLGRNYSGLFNVVPAGSLNSAPVLLPMLVSPEQSDSNVTVTIAVTLDAPAPPRGAYVTLTCAQITNGTFPTSLYIPAGETHASFSFVNQAFDANITTEVTAAYNGFRKGNTRVVGDCGDVPDQPQVTVTGQGSAILLQWPPSFFAASYHQILRSSTSSTPPLPLYFDGQITNEFYDTVVEPNTTYHYQVVAINDCGASTSAVVSASIAPPLLPPVVLPRGGRHFDWVVVELSNRVVGATVRYTTDGSVPTSSSAAWDSNYPIVLTNSARVLAKTFLGANESIAAGYVFDIVQANPVSCGDAMARILAATNEFSPLRGYGYHVDRFRFAGTSGYAVVISLVSTNFDTFLYLKAPDGSIVATNDDCNGTDSKILCTPRTNGQFVIEVTTRLARKTGPYTLALTCTPSPELDVLVNSVAVTNNSLLDLGIAAQSVNIARTLTLTNSGATNLTVSNIVVNPSAAYSLSPTPPASLNLIPGAFSNYTLTFNSSSTGVFTGAFSLHSTDADNGDGVANPFVLNLSARANLSGTPPAVTITSPAGGGDPFNGPLDLTVTANASAATGSVAQVEFFGQSSSGFASLGVDTASPFSIIWSNLTTGTYTLLAYATDTAGRVTNSVPVTFSVDNRPVAMRDRYAVFKNSTAVELPILANDADEMPAWLWLLSVGSSSNSTITTADYKNILYTPNAGFTGHDSFEYAVVDYWSGMATATVAVVVLAFDPDNPPNDPYASITWPTNHLEVDRPLTVTGTVYSAWLYFWQLQYFRIGDFANGWVTFAEGESSLSNTNLGVFDPTLLPDGFYQIRLKAVDWYGTGIETAPVLIHVLNSAKVGAFTLAFTDLQIPVAGLPITITRTYDSRNTASGDFGAGWNLNRSSMRLQQSGVMGRGWQSDGTFACFSETEPHLITIVGPGEKEFRFQAVLRVNYSQSACPNDSLWQNAIANMAFNPLPGTFGTLAALNDPSHLEFNPMESTDDLSLHEFRDDLTEEVGPVYSPAEFVFTSPDQRRFQFDASGQLVRMTDPNGNTLTFTRDGITHSSGKGVKFVRDAQDRITDIYDPMGLDSSGQPAGPAAVRYKYDDVGNLIYVHRLTDRAPVYQMTAFGYENVQHPHHLTRIVDPRGVTGIRNEYGEDGRLKSTTDALGNTTQFLHDLSNRVEIVINRLGAGTTNSYDSRGNVTAIVNALGQTNRFAYDANNQVIQTIDALGFTNSFGYDANGKRNAVTNALGQVTRFAFDGYGQLSSKTDALTNTTSFEYSALGSRTAVVDAMGHRTGIAHDAHGRPTAVTNALGQLRAQSGSDANGSLQFVSEVGGLRMDFGYDGNLNTTNTSFGWTNPFTGQARMLATTTEFDAAGRITRVTDPDNQSRRTIYDEAGRVSQSIGRMGETNSHVYDAKGNLIETSFPDGTVTRSVYDANDQMTHTVDRHLPGVEANGSHPIYDVLGRVERTERLAGMQIDIVATGNVSASVLTSAGQVVSWSSTVYDAGGRVRFTTNAAGVVTETQYDPVGRQTAVIVAQTNRTDFAYDAAGRLRFTTNPLGRLTQHEYDAKGRKIKTILPDNSYVTNSYDEIGRLFAVRDPMGRTTDMEYDDRGRLKAVVLPQVFNPEGGTNARPRFEYEYDVYGNLTVVRDAKGRETKSTYDAFGQLLSRKLPLQQTNFHIYNALGQLAVAVDFKGQSNRFAYDGLGRVATHLFYAAGASVAARTNTFEYEPGGRWQRFIRPEGTNEIDRNIDGAVTNILSAEGRITYEHDAAAGWLKRAFTTHSDVRYDYDGLGRLKTVAVYKRNGTNLPAPEITTNTYTRLGSLENVYFPNGTRTAYEYNRLNQLTNMTQFNRAGQLLARYAYTVASDGQRLTAVETRRESGGTYSTNWLSWSNDALRRLVRETCVSTLTGLSYTNAYVYDLVGNRLWKTNVSNTGTATLGYTYNTNDQLLVETSPAGSSFTNWYDANGSLTNRSSATETNRYSYDLEGRLTGATIHRIETGQSLLMTNRYFYNAAGIRVRTEMTRSVAGGAWVNETNVFLNDPQNLSGFSQVFEELTGAGAVPTTTYTLGGQVLSQHKAGAVSHLMTDGNGSTRLLTDASGAITNRFTFDAFGVPLDFTNSVLSPARTKILYAGEQHDAGLSQYYLRARYYSPATARFGIRDALEGQPRDPLTLHRYTYVQNNPVNLRDPSGNETIASVALATSIAQQLQRMYVKAVARHGYVGSKKATELGQSRDSILDAAAGRDASPETDSAVILVHGVTHKWPGWSQEPDAATGTSFQEKLTLERTRPGMASIAFDPLPHDFYEFNWGGFSIGGFGFIPIKSVHQMALVHLEMTHFLVWMQGYANIDLISHSWGTTLTYDLQNISGIETRHWVTMGSPLKSTTPKPPGNTGDWINLYDLNDKVVHLEMFPPFPYTGGLPLPESLTGPGLTINPNVTAGLNRGYDFRASVNPHWWVHSDYWVSPEVATDLRDWLE